MPVIGIPVASVAPDYVEPLVGVRGWDVDANRLVSPTMERPWQRIEHAECHIRPGSPPSHMAPNRECRCGLYAFHDLDSLHIHYPTVPVVGVVSMWGACCVHCDGVRSEYMRIDALVQSTDLRDRYTRIQAWWRKWMYGAVVSVVLTAIVGMIPFWTQMIGARDVSMYLFLVGFLVVFMLGVWISVVGTLLVGWVLPARRRYRRQPSIDSIARRYGVPVIARDDVPRMLQRMNTVDIPEATRPLPVLDAPPVPAPSTV